MDGDRVRRQLGWAKVSLGISILVAAGGFLYFWLQGELVTGVGLAILLTAAGIWEHRRRIQDIRASEQFNAEAEERRAERDR